MSVKSGQSLTVMFPTNHPITRTPTVADTAPYAMLYVNGVQVIGATFSITNVTPGLYSAAVTLPTLAAGDMVAVRFTATVGGVAGQSVWQDIADTARLSDGVTLADDAITAAKFDQVTAFPLTAEDADETELARVGKTMVIP